MLYSKGDPISRWLSNRDGFIRLIATNIDYIGIEEVMRMGAFFDVHCLIENQFVSENDDNSYTLFQASPFFTLRNGILETLGWSGGVLADILSKDRILNEFIRKNIMEEQTRRISVRGSQFCVYYSDSNMGIPRIDIYIQYIR